MISSGWITPLVMAGFFIAMCVSIFISQPNEYRKGQIDAINGKICFELKKQEDSTIRWEEIDPCAEHTKTEP